MIGLTNHIVVDTARAFQFIDITEQVERFVVESPVRNGCVVIFSKHTTAAIKINENEPLLLLDMEQFLGRIASRDDHYLHNDFTVRTVNMTDDECPNGHAHCQHLLMNSSETVPVVDGEMQLGRWQKIFLVELDGPRAREILLQAFGG
ncbi:secondary thiamine-phosphate synthase enzyme YjbQ [Dehalococcoidia bacterium]|nr:secondary thiamine-phosphate synthase enzyme YjbQ [Dehalococcoidia bacterium]